MNDRAVSKNPGPLAGVRILDMTTVIMGPYATLLLADMGADVIKIESPMGDISRQSTPARAPKMGHAFLNGNRNKRSVSLDLKNPFGRDAFLAIVKTADVLVYNVRPEAMRRLNLGYSDLKKVNPKLIYVGGFGFSERGPYAGRPAYDDIIQGMTGIPWLAAEASGDYPRYAPNAYTDRVNALHISNAVLAALYHCKCTGQGQSVEVPMFENVVHLIMGEHLEGETFLPAEGHMGHPRVLSRGRKPYRTKDGFICAMVYNDKQWKSLFEIMGEPHRFESDPRFSSQINRIKNIDFVYKYLADILITKPTAEWLQLFGENDIPVGPMNSLEDILHDEHLAAINYFTTSEHPSEGKIRVMKYPTEFSETPTSSRRHAPLLGENTVEVLLEAGYDPVAIDGLIKQRIAISPAPRPDENKDV